ncbi:hypothetical protein P9393_22970, partial [Escherichia coli]
YGFESQQTLTRTFKNYFDVLPDRVSARYFPSAFARFPSSYGCGCIGLMNDRFLF